MAHPLRAIRVPEDLWAAAQAVAKENGDSLSEVMRQALFAYVSKNN